ncbi:thioredoxin-like protein [Camillea tinctor]|nr:thioredoxin-like protein [Camillea tinctor]
MPGKIECYFDIASFYSYVAFIQILRNKELFEQHSIDIEIHPVLLGAINAGSGNKPPWTLPVKATYGRQDMQRAAKSVGLVDAAPPGDLMEASRTMLPLRALLYIKSAYPRSAFLTTFHYLFHVFWTQRRTFNDAESLHAVLLEVPSTFSPSLSPISSSNPYHSYASSRSSSFSSSSRSSSFSSTSSNPFFPPSPPPTPPAPLFPPSSASLIVTLASSSTALKAALKHNVEQALARGAFGAPWLWVSRSARRRGSRSSSHSSSPSRGGGGGGGGGGWREWWGAREEGRGEEAPEDDDGEPFFGSDRWHFVYEYLGLPYRGVQLLAPRDMGNGMGAGAKL